MKIKPIFIVLCSFLLLISLAQSTSISIAADGDCVIPDSGPWPPCATGGGASPSQSQQSNNDCVIPSSGPWPPCASNGGGASGGSPSGGTPSGSGDCVIPSSGPWPPCASNGGGASPDNASSNDSASADGGDCVIPTSGPWPPCASSGGGAAAPEPAPTGTGQLIISYVNYDGAEPRREGDEYAVIQNVGDTPVNLRGWRLNAGDRGQDFTFPDHILEPGASCRVYTDEIHPQYCGFSFNRNSAIWNNRGDCGLLFDPGGQLVHEYCY